MVSFLVNSALCRDRERDSSGALASGSLVCSEVTSGSDRAVAGTCANVSESDLAASLVEGVIGEERAANGWSTLTDSPELICTVSWYSGHPSGRKCTVYDPGSSRSSFAGVTPVKLFLSAPITS